MGEDDEVEDGGGGAGGVGGGGWPRGVAGECFWDRTNGIYGMRKALFVSGLRY